MGWGIEQNNSHGDGMLKVRFSMIMFKDEDPLTGSQGVTGSNPMNNTVIQEVGFCSKI